MGSYMTMAWHGMDWKGLAMEWHGKAWKWHGMERFDNGVEMPMTWDGITWQ